ncbi:poly(U)-specific endoribonuclease [Ictalurus punctatus]|uniref:Uridylate-specific endoribonuclease n=1 Tax=Ictalurus punctatus TaxID=7998 RepID=A0A9F7TNZ2_ICTPU|nr:poly(U)-specific endoribonuclease [Ictalurus punctatus]XP_053544275.1 poly(U)-specific endoribonuclease [Ictalurus punctatus]XP_053544276.1 poly(U)-specific endoribonuclease [Ictalurus punctatus]XP_053544277.1 poly(U)-specific endoribonuclease [Ictalurus punctatus]XP_053544278.1 poly(U)-specific endoribonuclease [Ictalurus punctatus]XP_053544279.1 poly(U)-specific endoribonuclease [Ictalurus punctatus]XP_053544281.1 poly(U)-specific endoribonuclease [Ictalurus punctatus]XP_053544282.1 pol
MSTGVAEKVTSEELEENNIFLNAILQTQVMKLDVNDRVISLQFSWKGLLKPLGSSFIGVSPEFEVALYTIIFLNRNDQVSNTVVKVDKYLLEVMVCRQGHAIGTSYPKLLDKTLGACSFSTDQSKKI